MQVIGNQLKTAREALGMTRADAAKMAGISVSTVQRLETDHQLVKVKHLFSYMRAVNLEFFTQQFERIEIGLSQSELYCAKTYRPQGYGWLEDYTRRNRGQLPGNVATSAGME